MINFLWGLFLGMLLTGCCLFIGIIIVAFTYAIVDMLGDICSNVYHKVKRRNG
jgi:hypothetical protein